MVIGIDEVGRGCWAGPLVAAAVKLDHNFAVSKVRPWKLTDSKKMTKLQREHSASEIKECALAIGVGWVEAREVDKLGLTKSVQLAMQRAIDQIDYEGHEIIIDGNINYLKHLSKTKAIIKADGTIPAVSAASIIAKVARDTYMQQLGEEDPRYLFEKHVGYGTPAHAGALKKFGVSVHHRLSYKPIQALL